MKLLVFSPYYPPHIGGLETHSDEFNKYLSQRGVDITVFTPHLPSSTPKKEILHGDVKIVRFPAFEIVSNYPLPKFWLPSFWALLFSLRQEKPDAIVSRTRFFFSSFIALIYAKVTRTKLIHIEHGSDFVKLSSSFKSLVAKLYDYTLGFIVFRYSDLNISISKAVQKFVQRFDSRPSPVIYRGIDFDQIDAITPNENFRNQFPEKVIVGVIARLYKWKGIEYSIQAIKTLPPKWKSKVVFIIIGDGEDFKHLKNISDNSIHMLGNLPRAEAVSILKTFDIFIHSSLPGGGLSTSLLEAMACGCAIIATPNEGAGEIIENEKNGLIVSVSTSEITSAIINLLEDNDKHTRLSNKARVDVQENFSWDMSINKYYEIFKDLQK